MSQNKRVRIVDIARAAGVSPATVSRLLNQKEGEIKVGEETRSRILNAIDELGYERSLISSLLRSEKTGIVSAVCRNVGGTFLNMLMQHVMHAAHEQNIELLVSSTRLDSRDIEAQAAILQGQLFDGFLVLGTAPTYETVINRFKSMNKPFVSVATGMATRPPLVNVDEALGINLLMSHLSSLGHQRIAFLGNINSVPSQERFDAYQAYLKPLGLTLPDAYVQNNLMYTPEDKSFVSEVHKGAAQAAQQLMQLDEPPTAILCVADGYAAGAVKGLLQMGLRIPEDISVVGFDGSLESEIYHPPITTIRQPVEQIASAAIELLLKLIDNPEDIDHLEQHMIIKPELLVRSSTTNPNTA